MASGDLEWIFTSLRDAIFVDRETFDCGVLELNEYLKKYARQNDRRGIGRTFVAISEPDSREVAGYYSVSMSEIRRESLPEIYRRGLPRYPVPVLRLTKLAVALLFQGKGLGKELLMELFRKAVRLSSEVGIYAVTVDAKDEQSKSFYLKYGFIPLVDAEMSLFIPLDSIIQLLEE